MKRPIKTILVSLLALAPAVAAVAQEKKPHFYGKVVALCVGIEDYGNVNLPPAPGTVNDATKLGQALATQYGYEVKLLIGPRATKAGIIDGLKAIGAGLGPDDVLIFFFAGHGQVINLPGYKRAGYLLPYGARLDLNQTGRPDDWEAQAINMTELTTITDPFRSKHVLLLVDACCSGFMTRRGGGGLEFRHDLIQLLKMPSRTVLAATTESQAATTRQKSGKEQGIFTTALLAALNTGMAKSVTDVFIEVRKEVVSESNKNMTPQMGPYGRDGERKDGEFVFLPLRIPTREIESTIPGRRGALTDVVNRWNERLNLQTRIQDVIDAFEAADYHYAVDRADKDRIWTQKRKQFEENAAIGDVLAMEAYHYCLAKRLGSDIKDEPGAYHWAKIAYETDHVGGRHVLGRCLYYPIGTTKNAIAGLELIRDASKKDFPISHIQVGMDCAVKNDIVGARRAWQKASDAGVFEARVYLAELHLGSIDGMVLKNAKVDREKAIEVLLPAAAKGKELPDAQLLLAKIYARRDKPVAFKWLEQAARNGQPNAQGLLARELAGEQLWAVSRDKPLSLDLPPNPREALDWAEMAAAQGDPDGLLVMAQSYAAGGDFARGLEACRKAAAQNHPCAFLLESRWYHDGDTVHPKDADRAYQLGKRSADLGYASGQAWIGALYADQVVPKDQFTQTKQGLTSMHHALHYWTLAAEQRDETAQANLKEVAGMIRANPEAGYWDVFQRDYPVDVPKFRYHCGGQVEVKPSEPFKGPPSERPVFGVFVVDYSGAGILLSKVTADTPAARAGLEVGDALLQINGQVLNSTDDFIRAIDSAGATVKITVRDVRDGNVFEKEVRLNK